MRCWISASGVAQHHSVGAIKWDCGDLLNRMLDWSRYKELAAERTKAAATAEAAAAAAAEAERATSPALGRDEHREGSGEPDDAAAGAAAADSGGEAPADPAKPAALPISVVKVSHNAACTAANQSHIRITFRSSGNDVPSLHEVHLCTWPGSQQRLTC